MSDPHEDLVEAGTEKLAELIGDHCIPGTDLETAMRAILALIAERTKDAPPEMCREARFAGFTYPEGNWHALHSLCALWPKEKP